MHKRYIFPVGQGGFSLEEIGDCVVVYDCGSLTSNSMVESCIDWISQHINHVDWLYISHFDTDHVNSIRYLLSSVKVFSAVVSMIPQDLKAAYGVYTNGAYTTIMGLLAGNDVNIIEVGGEENIAHTSAFQSLWEWIAKSMMTKSDFSSVMTNMKGAGLDLAKLSDADYIESEKVEINGAFKSVFGANGPNRKGLIMLSQRCKAAVVRQSTVIKRGIMRFVSYGSLLESPETSCLYVGDANLRNKANRQIVTGFLNHYRSEEKLLLMQIPHHGSRYNIGAQFETDFSAHYYFVNDEDTRRLQGSANLFKSLMSQKKLLVARGVSQDLIKTQTVL